MHRVRHLPSCLHTDREREREMQAARSWQSNRWPSCGADAGSVLLAQRDEGVRLGGAGRGGGVWLAHHGGLEAAAEHAHRVAVELRAVLRSPLLRHEERTRPKHGSERGARRLHGDLRGWDGLKLPGAGRQRGGARREAPAPSAPKRDRRAAKKETGSPPAGAACRRSTSRAAGPMPRSRRRAASGLPSARERLGGALGGPRRRPGRRPRRLVFDFIEF